MGERNCRLDPVKNIFAGILLALVKYMKKFQVTILFKMDDDFMALIPSHRVYINTLIEKGIIDQYVVSMETQRVWITMTAADKNEVEAYLAESPVYRYWTYDIDELFVYDGQHYRLPAVQLN